MTSFVYKVRQIENIFSGTLSWFERCTIQHIIIASVAVITEGGIASCELQTKAQSVREWKRGTKQSNLG